MLDGLGGEGEIIWPVSFTVFNSRSLLNTHYLQSNSKEGIAHDIYF